MNWVTAALFVSLVHGCENLATSAKQIDQLM
jgi:hypothetical protein